jgi:transcriptional regulator of nitric oxide reductase
LGHRKNSSPATPPEKGQPVNKPRTGTYRTALRSGLLILALAATLLFTPEVAMAAEPTDAEVEAMLGDVMPDADFFSDKRGDPPVYRAYVDDPESGDEALVGFVYKTADVPPNLLA